MLQGNRAVVTDAGGDLGSAMEWRLQSSGDQ